MDSTELDGSFVPELDGIFGSFVVFVDYMLSGFFVCPIS
jgi:hypothetical protein